FGGVVSALAVSSDGDRIAAANWAGQVALYRRDGTPSASTTLPDAIVALALHSTGTPVYVVLANHVLVVIESDGRQRWRKQLDSKLRYIAQLGYDLLVATEAGTLLWLNDNG